MDTLFQTPDNPPKDSTYLCHEFSENEYSIYFKSIQKSYSMDALGVRVMKALCENKSAQEIQSSLGIDEVVVEKFVQTFSDNRLLPHQLKSLSPSNSGVHIYGVDRFLGPGPLLSVIVSIITFVSAPAFIVSSIYSIYYNDLLVTASEFLIAFANNVILDIIITLLLFGISSLLHELAHAAVAVNLGLFVPEISIEFKFGISPYSTKVVGLDRLKAINRIPFYLAGINANLLVSAICLVVLLFVSNVIIFHILLVNVLLAIVNLFVFPPATDGSKALRALLSSFA